MSIVILVLSSALNSAFVSRFPLRSPPKQKQQQTALKAGLDPSLLIPTLLGTTAVVFFVFNGVDVNSQVDLTDQGLAKAKAKRYAERKAKGLVPENKEQLDPYRWFAEEDEEVDLINPPSKKGGGCG